MRSETSSKASGRRGKILAFSAVVVLVVLLLAGKAVWDYGRNTPHWWGTSDSTKVLLADPMSSTDLPGLTLVEHEQTEHAGLTGKPGAVHVVNTFSTGDLSADEARTRLLGDAESHGWTFDPATSTENYSNAKKEYGHCSTLFLTIATDPESVPSANGLGLVRVTVQFGGSVANGGNHVRDCSTPGDD